MPTDTTRDVTVEEARRLADVSCNGLDPDYKTIAVPENWLPDTRLALRNLAAQIERLTAERDHWQAEAARIDGARLIEVSSVFKRAADAEAARDQQAVMLKDMNTLATALTAERDALRETLNRCREYGFNGSRVYDAMKAVTADEVDTLLAQPAVR